MNNLRNYAASFIIMAVLVSLCLTIYSGFETKYAITRDTGQETNIMEKLSHLNLIQGINRLIQGVQGLKNANLLNPLDLLGALASAGIGILQVIGGTATLPFDIFGVLSEYYFIPPIIETFVGSIVVLVIGFMLLQAYIKPFHPI
jgi:hypothetical protein